MFKQLKIVITGTGVRVPKGKWLCKKCGRAFKLPKVSDSCETLFSICMTCYGITCFPVDHVGRGNSS